MEEMIYEYLREIPKGKVVTYGQIAEHLGNKYLARYVGNVLHHNRDGIINPCYKVVNSKGRLSAAYSFGGQDRQKELLEADGIAVKNYTVDLKKYQYTK